ncbi:E3 ubiquitin-protein ligase RBBP6 isoform X2 [Eupeodes corollae]|uniref:E3 ubiquitin-protein ligase RBBP6 isoform X2 n=1 Tax=Eupeodes corollae TaxID=290404 RepID=UPI002490CB9E|nr:E3 ubiquitin-protein ligase RBBP6 isoform X2 [Eupeodes corollae]
MSVHYKFKSSLDFDTITFDGLHISVNDFRKAVVQQKRLGKTNDFELQITNAQTKEEYQNDNDLIPKNTSLIISRIPQISKKSRDTSSQPQNTPVVSHVPKFDSNTLDLSQMNASEEDKIQAMMAQSTVDYDPRGYQKIRGPGQTGEVPPTYRCYKCHQNGHWIKNCPLPHSSAKKSEIRRNTGIPKSFLHEKGAENEAITEEIVIPEKQAEVPDELLCSICKDIFRDAVMIPCCGSSFCDDCVRTALLESEENECPDCKEKGTSPGSLIPNRFLRSSVNTFKNETGYERRRKNNGVHEVVSNATETKEEPVKVEKQNEKDKETEAPVKSSPKKEVIPKHEDEQLTPPKSSPKKEVSLSPKKEVKKPLQLEEKEIQKKEPEIEQSSPKRRVEVVMPQREILHNSDPHQRPEEQFKQNQSSYYGSSVPDLPHRSNPSEQYQPRPDSYMRHPKHNQGIVPPNMGYCNNYGNRTERYYYPRDSYNVNAAPYPYVQNPRMRQMAPHANIQPYYQGMAGPIETGIIEDPLEAFNRIMKEKEKRKEMKRLATERSERHRPPAMSKRGPREPSPLAEKRIRHRSSPVNERRNRSPLRQEKPSSHRNIEREKTIRSHRNHYPGNNRSFSRSNSPPPQRRFSKSPIRRRSRSRSHPRSHSRENDMLRHDNRHPPKHVLQQSHRIDHEKEMIRYNKRPQGRFSETRSLSEIGPKENRRHNSKMRENGNQMFDNYGPSSSRKMFFETEVPENRDVPYEFHHERNERNERRSKVSMSKFEEIPRSEKRIRENHEERRQSLQSPDEEPPKPELDKRSKDRKKKKEKDEKTEKKSKKDKKEKRKRERHKDEPKKHPDHKKSRRDTDSMANSNEKGSDESRNRSGKKDNFKGSNDESMDDKAETFTPDININRHLDDDHIVETVQSEVRRETKNPFRTEKSPLIYKNERCKQIMDNNGSELNTPTSFIDTTPENYAGKWDNFDFSMPNSEDVRGDNDRDFEYNSHNMFHNSSPPMRNEQIGMNRHFGKIKDSHSRSHAHHEERRPKHEETVKENRSEVTAKSTPRKPSPVPSEAGSSSSSKTPQGKKRRKKSKHKKEKSSKRSSSAESSKKSSSKHKKSRTEKKKKSKRNESR